MIQYSVKYSDELIKYRIERSDRKTVELNVLPDMSVLVIAPDDISYQKIEDLIHKRAYWILKQREYFKQFVPQEPPRKYVGGETHRFFGKQYRLKIVKSDKSNVKLEGKFICIFTSNQDDPLKTKRLLYKWYREHANIKFNELIDQCLGKLKKHGINKPDITIRIMKSRWGSCDAGKKKIILNLELIKAPSHCIEYVVMHELCHIKYPDHDNNFYKFLTLVMPDWKERKDKLEKAFL